MSDAPWVKFYSADFLQGVTASNLTAEDIGVYTVVLLLIAERGGPVEYDKQWLMRMTGVSSSRRAGQIVDKLLDRGKLTLTDDGRLANARMIEEVEARRDKSAKARKAADASHEARRKNAEKEGRKSRENPSDLPKKTEENGPEKTQERRETAIPVVADAIANGVATRARDSETQNIYPSQPNTDSGTSEAENEARDGSGREPKLSRLEDRDLWSLYQAVAEASGHSPSAPAQVDRAFGFVQKWRDAGIDFDTIVLPTIRAAVLKTREPTRTLGRFDAAIQHEAARLKATPAAGKYSAPPTPLLEPQDEDPAFRPLRAALLKRVGPAMFTTYVNPVRFEDVGDQGNGRRPLRINDSLPPGTGLMDSDIATAVQRTAKEKGFTDVW